MCVFVLFLMTGWLKKSLSLLSNSSERRDGKQRSTSSFSHPKGKPVSLTTSQPRASAENEDEPTNKGLGPRLARHSPVCGNACSVPAEHNPPVGPDGRSSTSPRSSRAPCSPLWHSVPIENNKKSHPLPAHLTGRDAQGDRQGTRQASEQHFWWFIFTLCLMPSYSSKL